MRKYLWLVVFACLLAFASFANGFHLITGMVPGGVALVFDEQLEATGAGVNAYDETASGVGSDWAETIGSGASIDANKTRTDVTGAPATWDDDCLYIDNNSTNTQAKNTMDSMYTLSYTRIEFIVDDTADLGNGETIPIASGSDDAANYIWRLLLGRDGSGDLYFRFTVDAATNHDTGTISLDTKYRFEMYYNAAGGYEMRMDDAEIGSGGSTTRNGLKILSLGGWGTNARFYIACDNVAISTEGWPGAP